MSVTPRLLADVLPANIDAQLAGVSEHLLFYLHFGHFMATFASAESSFHEFFHSQSELAEPVARALIGGEQLSKVSSVCNNMVQAGAWDATRKAKFQELIDQTNAISQFRHTLVHRGVERIKGGIASSNAVTAKSAAAVEVLRFNLEHMKDASADLVRIILELFVIRSPEMAQRAALPGSAIHDALAQPWRYKRIAPDKPNQPLRTGNQ